MRKVSFGVIGCGNVANNYYLPYIARRHRLTAVCDLVAERARRSADVWKAERWYDDPDRLLKDAEVEAVVIATSHEAHAELAVRAAEEGKHFIVQKPMALSLDAAEQVVKSVEKSGVIAIAEPSDALLSPVFKTLKNVIRELGGHCYSLWHVGHSGPTWSEAFFDDERGGGVLFDLAVYGVSRLQALLGSPLRVAAAGTVVVGRRFVIPPDEVTAAIRRDTYGRGVYYFHDLRPSVPVKVTAFDNFVGILEYSNGGLGVVFANYTTFSQLHMPPVQVYCLRGTVAVNPYAPSITVSTPEGSRKVGREVIGAVKPYYHLSVDHLAECIERGVEPLPSVKWGFEVTRIMLALEEAAKKRTWVDLT